MGPEAPSAGAVGFQPQAPAEGRPGVEPLGSLEDTIQQAPQAVQAQPMPQQGQRGVAGQVGGTRLGYPLA